MILSDIERSSVSCPIGYFPKQIKKDMNYITRSFIASLLIMCFASCSSDDTPELSPAEVVAGTYTCTGSGTSHITNMNLTNEQKVIIEKVSDSKVKVEYKIDYNGASFGTFTTDNATATVDKNTGAAAISGTGSVSMGMGDKLKDYTCTLSGKISKDKKDVEFIFSIPEVMGGLTITLH